MRGHSCWQLSNIWVLGTCFLFWRVPRKRHAKPLKGFIFCHKQSSPELWLFGEHFQKEVALECLKCLREEKPTEKEQQVASPSCFFFRRAIVLRNFSFFVRTFLDFILFNFLVFWLFGFWLLGVWAFGFVAFGLMSFFCFLVCIQAGFSAFVTSNTAASPAFGFWDFWLVASWLPGF